MKPDKLQDLIARTRRVRQTVRADHEPPALPLGFARKIVQINRPAPSGQLVCFQTWSYAGLGVAMTIALSVFIFHSSPEIAPSDPTDPWMEMPMTNLVR